MQQIFKNAMIVTADEMLHGYVVVADGKIMARRAMSDLISTSKHIPAR